MDKSKKLKIAMGALAQESNSFSPFLTKKEDFIVHYGEAVLKRFPAAADVFQQAECEIIPAIAASAVPGGVVDRDAFLSLCDELISKIPQDVDGVWLHLHGAMYVKELSAESCSGEEFFMARLREKLGREIPVAASMDMHGNLTPKFVESMDIIRGYHTAPHERYDLDECARRTAQALLLMIGGQKMYCVLKMLPLRLAGERFMTQFSPAKETVELSEKIESERGIICATVFVGMAWCDTSYNTLSVLLTLDQNIESAAADKIIKPIGDFVAKNINSYDIPARNLSLEETLDYCENSGKRPFYISDSGDNVTAGAAGDNTLFLKTILAKGLKNYLVAGITDADFVNEYYLKEVGSTCTMALGATIDANSERLNETGVLLKTGKFDLGSRKGVKCCLVRYGDNFVIIPNIRCDFTNPVEIAAIAGALTEYKAVVVKLGYLYPLLQADAKDSCIALTPGNCTLDTAKIKYQTKAFFEK